MRRSVWKALFMWMVAMLWCSQPWWDGMMPLASPSGPCFSSSLGTAGFQLDTRRWGVFVVSGCAVCAQGTRLFVSPTSDV